jgi:Alginate lyase
MNGSEKASWSNTSGTHTLDVCEAITEVPAAKPEVVAAQIHDASDDVLQIRLEGQKLMVQYDDGKSEQIIDPDYTLGAPYHVRIVAADSKVEILYNGEKKAELPLNGSGWYFKVGAYVQANRGSGDADSVGAVAVYALNVDHGSGSGSSATPQAATERPGNDETAGDPRPGDKQGTGDKKAGGEDDGDSDATDCSPGDSDDGATTSSDGESGKGMAGDKKPGDKKPGDKKPGDDTNDY